MPDVGSRVQKSQERQKVNHDQGIKVRLFSVGDAVFVKNFSGSISQVDSWKGDSKQEVLCHW